MSHTPSLDAAASLLWDGISSPGPHFGRIRTTVILSTTAAAYTNATRGQFSFVPTNAAAQRTMHMVVDGEEIPFVVPKASYVKLLLRRHTPGGTPATQYLRGFGENPSSAATCADDMEGAIMSEMKFDSGSETITAQRVFFPTGGNESGARPMVTIVTQIKQFDPDNFPELSSNSSANLPSQPSSPRNAGWMAQVLTQTETPNSGIQPLGTAYYTSLASPAQITHTPAQTLTTSSYGQTQTPITRLLLPHEAPFVLNVEYALPGESFLPLPAGDRETKETLVGGDYKITSVPTHRSYQQVFEEYYSNLGEDGSRRPATYAQHIANAVFNYPYKSLNDLSMNHFQGRGSKIIVFRGSVGVQSTASDVP